MDQNHKTLFISDLHLDENYPVITRLFLQLLQSCDDRVDAIYILGDLFEAWIGDDDLTPFHQQIISALKFATQKGVPIYFIHGNRDFLIGKKFSTASGCQLLPDETKINLYDTPVLLMHGDTLCTQDVSYLKWRKFARNSLIKNFFLLLPLKIRRYLAKKMRAKSTSYMQSAPLEIMDVTQQAVVDVMQKHQVNYLIHGHTHKPDIHALDLINPAERIVLGAWHHQGSVLVWNENGAKKLEEYR